MRRAQFVGILAFAAAAAVGAQPAVFLSPRGGEPLMAGSTITIRWSEVPAAAQEVELLLILEGRHESALRLTAERTPVSRSFDWRIPNLSAGRASLVLRVGIQGREIEGPTSEAFAILPDPSALPEALSFRSGEMWIAEGASEPAGARLPLGALTQEAAKALGRAEDAEALETAPVSEGLAASHRAEFLPTVPPVVSLPLPRPPGGSPRTLVLRV